MTDDEKIIERVAHLLPKDHNMSEDGFKFACGSYIWFLKNNKVHQDKIISRIRVEAPGDYAMRRLHPSDKDAATIFGDSRIQYSTEQGIVDEKNAFATKQELLASL